MNNIFKRYLSFGMASAILLSTIATQTFASDYGASSTSIDLGCSVADIEWMDDGELVDIADVLSDESPEFNVSFQLLGTFEISQNDLENLGESTVVPESDDAQKSESFEQSNEIVKVPKSLLPDLTVFSVSLGEGFSQPLPLREDINFLVRIGNIGGAPVQNFQFKIYLDEKSNAYTVSQKLEPGIGGQLLVTMSGASPGTHTVKATVNENERIDESDYTNNEAYGRFTWQGSGQPTGLCAGQLGEENGIHEFPCMEEHIFSFSVRNLGTKDLSDVNYQIKVDGTTIGNQSLPILPSKKEWRGRFSLKFRTQGTHVVYLYVDPNNKQPDTNRDDNVLSDSYVIEFDTHYLGSKWASGSKISAYVDNQLLDIIDASAIESSLKAWNKEISKVQVDSVTFADINDFPTGSAGKLRIMVVDKLLDGEGNPTNAIAQTHIPASGTITQPYIEVSREIFSDIYFPDSSLSQVTKQKKTLTHEIGHALGLDHPFQKEDRENTACANSAIMWQNAQSNNVAFSIQPHDRYNIKSLYQ